MRRRFNALVYNVCDDLVHAAKGSLWDLQEQIRFRVRERVLPDLLRRVHDNDVVILTSDHGFVGLDPAYADVIAGDQVQDEASQSVTYRCVENPHATTQPLVDWGEAGRYRLAVGRRWFRRPGGAPAQFAHGGLSLHETCVPAVVLRRASAPIYRLALTRAGKAITAVEGEVVDARFLARNTGNRMLSVTLQARSAEYTVEPASLRLGPGEQAEVAVRPAAPLRPGQHLVRLVASYSPPTGGEPPAEVSAVAEIVVQPDPRRVEQSHALDIFDTELDPEA